MTVAGLTRRSLLHQRTVSWLEEFFFDHCDSESNRVEDHLDQCERKDIYDIYINEMKILYSFQPSDISSLTGKPIYFVDYTTFDEIWNNVFHWVKIRVYKQVSGKCWTCFWINDVRKSAEDKSVLLAAKRLHQLHRGGLYMLERRA